MFLLAVLRLRADKPLNAAERRRALRLEESAHQAKATHEQKKTLDKRMDRIVESYAMLSNGKYDGLLLNCLRNVQQLQKLFQSGQVPEILLKELAACKQHLEAVVRSMDNKGTIKLNGNADTITVAEHLYQSEFREYIRPIVDRIRQLLMETIDEEYRSLDKTLAQVIRRGYHETEAYTISDRVEVIVKALLKGWYTY
jgi:hypothetical protein